MVVDDFKPFRNFVCEMMEKLQNLQVICEASDGPEAVLKAVELKPDLILLDIGLPGLNGIDAARQIRKLVPESKIIFLSQESSSDVVQEALSLGAFGYVVKIYAGIDLPKAIEAACHGRQFASGGLADHKLETQVPSQRPLTSS